ncbi:MAG TPA: hypothetical protein VMS17_09990 [Gemmataceae bacterium]|nr:hypothetical protein [Gemmataceae bacterium]
MAAQQPNAHFPVGRGVYAVTIRQPQAAAVLARPGPFEHPAWETDYRGPLLIHAAKWATGDPSPDQAGRPAYAALLGMVELVDCVANGPAEGDPDEVEYVWVLANPRTFARPLPHNGRLGLFLVGDAVVASVQAALALAPAFTKRPSSRPPSNRPSTHAPTCRPALTTKATAMTHSTDMESRMRGVLCHSFEAVTRADRDRRFLERDDHGRPRWPSLREFMLAALHESGGDEDAVATFEQLPGAEQDRLLRYYERAFQPCKGLAAYSSRPRRGKVKSQQAASASAIIAAVVSGTKRGTDKPAKEPVPELQSPHKPGQRPAAEHAPQRKAAGP